MTKDLGEELRDCIAEMSASAHQGFIDIRRETIKEGNEELLRAIEMGRVSGNFDVLLHSVTQLYLAREEANTPTV